ncbi:MAG: DegV family protein [Clostridia bacterium]|nr:DegV family protein [Clostridia bacterium]
MKRIGFMIDTSADMPEELIEKYDLKKVNFIVNFDDEGFVAHEEISNEEFYAKIRETGIHPKTAQTPYQTLYDALLENAKECETLIFYTLSSKASGQYQTATLIAKELMEENPELDIRVVDTQKFSMYIGMAVIKAYELAQQGASADEIIEKSLEHINQYEVYLIVDDLNYLAKGGRLKKTTAIIGTMLDIKPVLGIVDGLIEPLANLRVKKKIYKKLVEMVKESDGFNPDNTDMMIIHSNEVYANELHTALAEEFGDEKITAHIEIGPIIGTHTGPGAVAVVFRKECL